MTNSNWGCKLKPGYSWIWEFCVQYPENSIHLQLESVFLLIKELWRAPPALIVIIINWVSIVATTAATAHYFSWPSRATLRDRDKRNNHWNNGFVVMYFIIILLHSRHKENLDLFTKLAALLILACGVVIENSLKTLENSLMTSMALSNHVGSNRWDPISKFHWSVHNSHLLSLHCEWKSQWFIWSSQWKYCLQMHEFLLNLSINHVSKSKFHSLRVYQLNFYRSWRINHI